ncbi:MAG: SUF system NifU family Fe-S cluster assembly protein [Bacilli bacterium]|nr:SUF system NifU family Fe-S cluster assembly protein [Bacilli bacterium]
MDSNLKREIILENYQNPKNKGLIDDDSYIKINMNNESCIDEVNLMVKIVDNKIEDIRFDGEACAMCISSSSIMIETLIGKTIDEAKNILKNFLNMIDEKKYDSNVLEDAIVYEDTYKQPNRKKCVLLSWWGIEKILNGLGENK